jgi:hypothetical protein
MGRRLRLLTDKIGTKHGSNFSFKLSAAIMAPPIIKVSNRRTQYLNYSKELKNQIKNKIRFCKWKSGSGQVE